MPDFVAAVGGSPDPEPLWLAFRAPSSVRTTAQAVLAEGEASSSSSDSIEDAAQPAVIATPTELPYQRQQRLETAAAAARTRGLVIAGAIGGVILVGGSVFAIVSSKSNAEKSAQPADAGPAPALAKTPAKPVKSEPIVLRSCACAFGDGQSTPRITLQLMSPPSDGSKPWTMEIDRQAGFVSEGRTAALPAKAGAVLPAASETLPPRMAMACTPGIVAVVAGKSATGWSSIDGAWKWNATLPAAAAVDAPGITPTSGAAYTGGCVPLATKGDAASVPLANGKRVTLSLKDGKVR